MKLNCFPDKITTCPLSLVKITIIAHVVKQGRVRWPEDFKNYPIKVKVIVISNEDLPENEANIIMGE